MLASECDSIDLRFRKLFSLTLNTFLSQTVYQNRCFTLNRLSSADITIHTLLRNNIFRSQHIVHAVQLVKYQYLLKKKLNDILVFSPENESRPKYEEVTTEYLGK